ncbi:MAG TPA: response regulator [Stellaceae bacterium]|jgi:CheY-like chemotaxis protein|nr:response regulator [Stellaceae bacterium]
MSSRTIVSDEADALAAQPSGEARNALKHDLGNELAVVSGFAWLALTSLQQLSEKLEGDAQTELQSIISMVERVKSSAEQGRKLLTAPSLAIPSPAPAARPADADIAPSSDKHRILAVDDSLPLLALLNKILTRAGYEVETFTDPRAALQRFGETPDAFDAIVTDEMMPDMTGAVLAQEVRAIRPSLPIILCTGAPETRRAHDVRWAQAVIRKPYQPRDLPLLVQEVIAAAEKARPHTFVACAADAVLCDDRATA